MKRKIKNNLPSFYAWEGTAGSRCGFAEVFLFPLIMVQKVCHKKPPRILVRGGTWGICSEFADFVCCH